MNTLGAMDTLSPIFALSDRVVDEMAALDPFLSTRAGIPGRDHLVTDYSPNGCAARADHLRGVIAELAQMTPTSVEDRLAKDFITERFGATLAVYEAGDWMRPLRAFSAPTGSI